MRILVENGAENLLNLGDVAMLQVAVARLRDLWPDSRIQVVTSRPDLLQKYCPGTEPLPAHGHYLWLSSRILPGRFYPLLSQTTLQGLEIIEDKARDLLFPLSRNWIEWLCKRRGNNAEALRFFCESIRKSDLVLAAGGGYITDSFALLATRILKMMRLAKILRKPIAMLGQGLGPMTNPQLWDLAKAVFPHIDLFASREAIRGEILAKKLGMKRGRFFVSGDDAVEMAYNARLPQLGNGIGVSLRVAPYSALEDRHRHILKKALKCTSKKLLAPLIPIPISRSDESWDLLSISTVVPLGSCDLERYAGIDTPEKVISAVNSCRIVVSSTYHAGVFALAQGIPVIGLFNSAYYSDKFKGLAHQFGAGCYNVLLDDPNAYDIISKGILAAWKSAEGLRSRLLNAAATQIEEGKAVYHRLRQIANC